MDEPIGIVFFFSVFRFESYTEVSALFSVLTCTAGGGEKMQDVFFLYRITNINFIINVVIMKRMTGYRSSIYNFVILLIL